MGAAGGGDRVCVASGEREGPGRVVPKCSGVLDSSTVVGIRRKAGWERVKVPDRRGCFSLASGWSYEAFPWIMTLALSCRLVVGSLGVSSDPGRVWLSNDLSTIWASEDCLHGAFSEKIKASHVTDW